MRKPGGAFIVLSGIAGVQALALLGYAVYDLISVMRFGIRGPEQVSNAPAVILQILIFALFGLAMAWVCRGWLRQRRWARAPFILGQLLALVVGVPLAQATGRVEASAGILLVAMAVAGVILALSRPVSRVLDGAGPREESAPPASS